MALTASEKEFVYDTSLQLLQQNLLTNYLIYGGSVGQSLRDMMLSSPTVTTKTNPFDEAITGTLRADARATLQNSKNVSEASSMVGVAETATASIKNILEEMQGIIDDVTKAGSATDAQKTTYNSLKSDILSIVGNTEYNGINLLDGSKWGTDQIDSNGNVYIQAYKKGGFDVNFQDLSKLSFSSLDGSKLSTDLSGQTTLVSNLTNSMTTIDDIYTSRISGLDYQATQLESQAEIYEEAAETRRQTPTVSKDSILMDLLLKNSGTILDTSS